MTASRTLLASSVLLAALLGAPGARSEALPREPLATGARAVAEPAMKLAQKTDEENEKERGRRGKRPGRNGGEKEGGGSQGDNSKADGDKAADQQRQEPQQTKEKTFKDKQEREDARRNAVKERQNQDQQAGEKARKQRQDAEAARESARKQRLEAEAARQNAFKQKQLEAQQAREKALKDKQDAEDARRNAAKQKQLQDQQATEKALKQRQDAEAARRGRRAPAKFDRAKADQEFERARKDAQQKEGKGPAEPWRPSAVNKFEELRKGRKTREVGSRDIITEPDKRVIVRDDKRTFIRHDETTRLARKGREVRRERRKDGTWLVITAGLAGALIHSILDDDGRVLRRSRRDRDGREHVLFDDRRSYRGGGYGPDYRPMYIDLPPPVVRIPRDRYIVEYDRASPEDIYDALNAPPVEDLDRGYSLDEVRQNYSILERMRRVDLDAINFAFASWEVGEDQYPKLDRIARAMLRVLDRSPDELFLIEGHTDAVGNEIDNLSLSDRRAETVAAILTDVYDIPPENLTTQGYGEEYLKELTDGPSRINRRVGVRRITPLLSREGWNDPS